MSQHAKRGSPLGTEVASWKGGREREVWGGVTVKSASTQDGDGEGEPVPSLRDEQRNPALQAPISLGITVTSSSSHT